MIKYILELGAGLPAEPPGKQNRTGKSLGIIRHQGSLLSPSQ